MGTAVKNIAAAARWLCASAVALMLLAPGLPAAHAQERDAGAGRPNLLLITVDDMNADSVGVFGAAVPGSTPHIDQLAREGLRFERAHVQVANCMPSRNVMWSGRYPHSNRVEGFHQVRAPGYETLPDLLRAAGYFTAVRNKVKNSTPYHPYNWDLWLDTSADGTALHPRDAASYGLSTTEGIRAARAAGKPFSIMLNIGDPHMPFHAVNKAGDEIDEPHIASRVFTAQEIAVPGFLAEDAGIRQELSHYYSSVRRADDAVGHILRALQASGAADNTLVMFLSDHGMPFPFAKTQLYHHSTRTPLIFRWPGAVRADSVDSVHMVSAVDLLPTLLEAVGVALPQGIEGRSFLPLLQGRAQDGRDIVFKEYNENSTGQRAPMRAAQNARFLYIFNAWSDGRRQLRSATRDTRTDARLRVLAETDEDLRRRMRLLDYRVPEELYDVVADPDCRNNLIHDPAHRDDADALRTALEAHLRRTNDHALAAFLSRDNSAALAAYMQAQDEKRRRQQEYIRAVRAEMAQRKAAGQPVGASSTPGD